MREGKYRTWILTRTDGGRHGDMLLYGGVPQDGALSQCAVEYGGGNATQYRKQYAMCERCHGCVGAEELEAGGMG